MWTKVVYCIFSLVLSFRHSNQLACRDENDRDVDWYVNYKLPKIDSEPEGSDLEEGIGYAYLVAPGSTSWKLSSKNVISGGSMLENTLNNFYSKNKDDVTYLFYNDDPPEGFNGSAVGHLKGVLAFDGTSGFWLVHSIPRFADNKVYKYPDNAMINGQSILCVTFNVDALNEISHQLLYSHPNIYAYGITEEVADQLDNVAKSLFTENPSFKTRGPLTRVANLKSKNKKLFITFAKDNQYKDDLYSGIVAPGLKANLLTETWRRGSGTTLPPSCKTKYSVIDVMAINMTAKSGRNNKSIAFKSTQDHSKWAISEGTGRNWICIADMNRMASQERRGGGALCFVSAPIRKAFDSIIDETDRCPT